MEEVLLQIIGYIALAIVTAVFGNDSLQKRRQLANARQEFDSKLSAQNAEWEQKFSQEQQRLELREQEAGISNMETVLDMMKTMLNQVQTTLQRQTTAYENMGQTVARMVANEERQTTMFEEHLKGVDDRNRIQEQLTNSVNAQREQAETLNSAVVHTIKAQHNETKKYLLDEMKPVIEFTDKFIASFSPQKRHALRGVVETFLNDLYTVANGELSAMSSESADNAGEKSADPSKPDPTPASSAEES